MSVSKISGLILGSAALVAGHGYVSGAVVDGTYYGGYIVTEYPYESDPPEIIAWSEQETDLGYIDGTEYNNSNIICHKDGLPGALEAPVTAGGSVELQWTAWPSSHHGPVITYLANCNGDCADVDKTTLEFFKIDQGGLISDTTEPGTWATDNLIANNNSRTVTIPNDIADGNYVLRHEIIALHSAEELDGAQNYPQCINLKVSGGGSATPSGTLGTALYKDTDPGILINIYTSLSTYDIPGPTLYTAGAAAATGSSSTTSSPATAAASATSTASPEVTSSASSVTSVVESSSSVSATPFRSPSPIPPFSNSSASGWRPSFSRRPISSSTVSTPAAQYTVPGGYEHHQSGSPTMTPVLVTKTETSTYWVTDVVTLTDKSVVQTTSAVVVAVTTTITEGSAPVQTSSPSTGSSSSDSGSGSSSGSSSSSSSSSGSSSSSSSSSGSDSSGSGSSTTTSASSTTTTSAEASDYNSSDWLSYLSSLSAEEVLNLLHQTFKWLVNDDKVHARDLSN
ncbi:uncharacterized protein N7483_003411 [Penicillium malachiteum]|uniref:uncharacterized protein n=1 Tax=Penicillium malachiteum TaxID=1324776 RepID=UPI0025479348|nr:uncharacterized protein N7483_003411 [Penicillium malachiteum]KAJ5728903.1 hypothetical protein N7483_003411 [Penicillium malachiteum]